MSGQTRLTRTRRSAKQKILDTLDELKDLVQRHCGKESAPVVEAAVNQTMEDVGEAATLPAFVAPVPEQVAVAPMPVVEMKMKKKSEGPKLWNEFVKRFEAEYQGPETDRNEIIKLAAEAWKQEKLNKGIATRRQTRRLPRQPFPASVAAFQQKLAATEAKRQNFSRRILNLAQELPENQRTKVMKTIEPILQPTRDEQQVQNALNALQGVTMTPKMTRKVQKVLNKASRKLDAQSVKVNAALKKIGVRTPLPVVAEEAPLAQTVGRASPLGVAASASAAVRPPEKRVQVGEKGATPKNIRSFSRPPRLPTPSFSNSKSSTASASTASPVARIPTPLPFTKKTTVPASASAFPVVPTVAKLPTPASASSGPRVTQVAKLPTPASSSSSASPNAKLNSFGNVAASSSGSKSVKQMMQERSASASASAGQEEGVAANFQSEVVTNKKGNKYAYLIGNASNPVKETFYYNEDDPTHIGEWYGYYNTRNGSLRQTYGPE